MNLIIWFLCCVVWIIFWTLSCTKFNSIRIILTQLTIRNCSLICSFAMFKCLQTKDCAWSGSSRNKLQRRCFYLWFFPLFLPLSFTYYDVIALTLMLSLRKCCNWFIIIFIFEVQYYPPLPSPAMDSVLVNNVLSELFRKQGNKAKVVCMDWTLFILWKITKCSFVSDC